MRRYEAVCCRFLDFRGHACLPQALICAGELASVYRESGEDLACELEAGPRLPLTANHPVKHLQPKPRRVQFWENFHECVRNRDTKEISLTIFMVLSIAAGKITRI